jgi:hypothetical protein
MKKYNVTFTGTYLIGVEAKNEEEAREKAIDLFDGYVDWETEVEEEEE